MSRLLPPLISRRAVLAGGTAVGFAPRVAGASPGVRRIVRLGQGVVADSPPGKGCRALAAAVAAHPVLRTALRVEVFDDTALGDDMAMVRGCMDGSIDMALCGSTVIGNFAPEVGLLDTPFLFRDAGAARAALDGDAGLACAEVLRAKGINLLAWTENGLRHMTANRPVRRPSDLAGLKLRVPQSDVELASFRALGAQPRAVPFPALYEALRTGEFDAQENPISLIEAARLYEVQKVVSLTAHIYSASMILASQDLLDDLSPAERDALAACARVAGAVTRDAADLAQREGVARLRAAGMQVVEDIDWAAFMAAAQPNLTAVGERYGPAFMLRLRRAGA